MNLVRVAGLEELVRLHYYESLLLAQKLPGGVLRIADVGSGAGFPGVPIAVFRPESKVWLIESHKRKAVFLRESTRQLLNLTVISDRAENVKMAYDWVVSRAVSPEEVLRLGIAQNFALLTTQSNLLHLPNPVSVENLPFGDQRVLAMFHVEHRDRIDQTCG